MDIYLDTSVIFSYFDKASKFNENALKLFSYENLTCFSGVITLLELQSVISRNLGQFYDISDKSTQKRLHNLTDYQKIPILLQYCLEILNISIFSPLAIEKLSLDTDSYPITNTYNLAYKLNNYLNLRTLDAIQIASAVELKIYESINLDYFVTNDENILDKKTDLYQKARILPISSDELVGILKI